MRRPRRIEVYPMTKTLKGRIVNGDYYSTESLIRATTMYVLHRDGMVIAQNDLAIRIPKEMLAEIGALAQDLTDCERRGIIR